MPDKKLETYRGLVMAQETDSNGHMNVQFYTTRYDQAGGQLLAHLGFDFQEMKDRQVGFAYVEMNIRYLKEVLEDDPIHIETSLIDFTHKVVTVQHDMKHSVSGQILSTALAKWVMFDKATRKAVVLPEDIRDRLNVLM